MGLIDVNRCIQLKRFIVTFIIGSLIANIVLGQEQDPRVNFKKLLEQAFEKEDVNSVKEVVSQYSLFLGETAGSPSVSIEYHKLPLDVPQLSDREKKELLLNSFKRILSSRNDKRYFWWEGKGNPEDLGGALREPGEIMSFMLKALDLAITRDEREQALDIISGAGSFLKRAQKGGGVGVYPFPANRKSNMAGRANFNAMQKRLDFIENEGLLDKAVNNGWVINDFKDGGLQFDNGLCGSVMLEAYEKLGESSYRTSALFSAEWAEKAPLSVNWNYNSFSVRLLVMASNVAESIDDKNKYLSAAIKKAQLGVLLGQLKSGNNKGKWVDSHNSLPHYHYIIIDNLLPLYAALDSNHPFKHELEEVLRNALLAYNKDFNTKGIPNYDKSVLALSSVLDIQDVHPTAFRGTNSENAWLQLSKFLANRLRRGHAPLSPHALVLFLNR